MSCYMFENNTPVAVKKTVKKKKTTKQKDVNTVPKIQVARCADAECLTL